MTSANDENLNVLYASLMPALARAAVGEFDTDLELDRDNDPRVNELLMGVQVLLDVINEKMSELEKHNSELAGQRDRSVTLLDEVLHKSLD